MSNSLLPPNASALETALEAATARVESVPVPLRDLWNPERCPASLLPWLAWALSVDEWSPDWPEAVKRAVLASSVNVHRRKGTVAAVREALAALGVVVSLREWFESGGAAHTFELEAYVNENLTGGEALLTETLYRALRRTVDAVKPVRSHYSFAIGVRFDLDGALAASCRGLQIIRRCAEARAFVGQEIASGLTLAAAGGLVGRQVARLSMTPSASAQVAAQLGWAMAAPVRALQVVRLSFESQYAG